MSMAQTPCDPQAVIVAYLPKSIIQSLSVLPTESYVPDVTARGILGVQGIISGRYSLSPTPLLVGIMPDLPGISMGTLFATPNRLSVTIAGHRCARK